MSWTTDQIIREVQDHRHVQLCPLYHAVNKVEEDFESRRNRATCSGSSLPERRPHPPIRMLLMQAVDTDVPEILDVQKILADSKEQSIPAGAEGPVRSDEIPVSADFKDLRQYHLEPCDVADTCKRCALNKVCRAYFPVEACVCQRYHLQWVPGKYRNQNVSLRWECYKCPETWLLYIGEGALTCKHCRGWMTLRFINTDGSLAVQDASGQDISGSYFR